MKLVWIFLQLFLLPVFFLWLLGIVSDDIWSAMGQKLQAIKEYVNETSLKMHKQATPQEEEATPQQEETQSA